jgi:AcrR family transcriptional regulator
MSSRATSPAPPEPAAPGKGEATRSRLIEAAHKLFLQQGFHGTSMRAIAEEAGLAVGGIYNHFSTKEDIFAAVLDAYHPYHALLPALAETEGETVEAFVRDAARRVKANIDGAEVRVLPFMFMEMVEFQGRHAHALVRKMLPAFYDFVQRFTERKGRLRNVPLPVLLRTMMSLMLGYLLTELILRGVKGLPHFEPDAHNWFDGMIDIYLHGILADEEAAA